MTNFQIVGNSYDKHSVRASYANFLVVDTFSVSESLSELFPLDVSANSPLLSRVDCRNDMICRPCLFNVAATY